MIGRLVIAVGLAVLAGAVPASAQPSGTDAQAAGGSQAHPNEPDVPVDSPRNALARYLELVRAGKLDEAARFLDLEGQDAARGPELARRLNAVLDRYVVIDLKAVSALPDGESHDDLPPTIEEIATIPNPDGNPFDVRMVRRGDHAERWRFSRTTVAKIDAFYERLEHRALIENAPRWLLRPGARGIPLWQWLTILALLVGAWLGGWLLTRVLVALLHRLTRRSPQRWDDVLLDRMRAPLMFAFTLLLVALISPSLGLWRAAQEFTDDLRRGGLFAVFFLALARGVDVGAELLTSSPWARTHPASHSLIPLGARFSKLFVLALGAVALLSVLGYPVASLLAGLGIGGLAIALAAQKTVENLFGAFSIGADQPFRVGDLVRIEDFVATVESIGLRSTRFRTLDRTLISIPNGKLAEMRLESLAARDRQRFVSVLALTYDTTAEQVPQVVAGIERLLREHPHVVPDSVGVFLRELGETALKIEASAYFLTADFSRFQGYRQEPLLAIMSVVQQAGARFATPAPLLAPAGAAAAQPPKTSGTR
jgi:MscS family membrane protein